MVLGQGVAQIENDSSVREGHQLANKIDIHLALFAKVDVDLFEFAVDLARVAAGEKDEDLERVVIELQLSLFRARLDHLGCFLFPAAATRIEFLENLQLGAFSQPLLNRTPPLTLHCPYQTCNSGSQTLLHRF